MDVQTQKTGYGVGHRERQLAAERGQTTDDRRQKSEIGGQKSEVRISDCGFRIANLEFRDLGYSMLDTRQRIYC